MSPVSQACLPIRMEHIASKLVKLLLCRDVQKASEAYLDGRATQGLWAKIFKGSSAEQEGRQLVAVVKDAFRHLQVSLPC